MWIELDTFWTGTEHILKNKIWPAVYSGIELVYGICVMVFAASAIPIILCLLHRTWIMTDAEYRGTPIIIGLLWYKGILLGIVGDVLVVFFTSYGSLKKSVRENAKKERERLELWMHAQATGKAFEGALSEPESVSGRLSQHNESREING